MYNPSYPRRNSFENRMYLCFIYDMYLVTQLCQYPCVMWARRGVIIKLSSLGCALMKVWNCHQNWSDSRNSSQRDWAVSEFYFSKLRKVFEMSIKKKAEESEVLVSHICKRKFNVRSCVWTKEQILNKFKFAFF